MLQKDGKVYVAGMEKLVLAEDLAKMTKEEIRQNLGTSVMQFFISYLDKTNAVPAETYPNIKHMYDCDHFVKNTRNLLLRNSRC